MVSKFTLLSNLLLATAALAFPSSSPVGAPLARSRETRQSSDTDFYNHWTGAAIVKTGGTFYSASGTFYAPAPSIESPDGTFSVWVGIDGATCSNRASILQAGVKTSVTNGNITYNAWGMWNTNNPYTFHDLTIGASDVITATVLLKSNTSGTVYLQNEYSGQLVWKMFDMDPVNALCGASAEWVVDDSGGTMAQVGGVIFTSAFASDSSGYVYKPYNLQDGALLLNMTQSGTVVLETLVSPEDETLVIIRPYLWDNSTTDS